VGTNQATPFGRDNVPRVEDIEKLLVRLLPSTDECACPIGIFA